MAAAPPAVPLAHDSASLLTPPRRLGRVGTLTAEAGAGGMHGRALSPSSDMRQECSAAAISEQAAVRLISALEQTYSLNDGYCMPALGFGTFSNTDSPDDMAAAVFTALEVGYRHLDCAESYKNEAAVGRSLERSFKEGVVTREDVFVTSKVWQTNHKPEHVRQACKNTLKNLGLTYLDMYLVHWPMAWEYTGVECEPLIPVDAAGRVRMSTSGCSIQDTWRAMEKLVDDGLVKSIGVSNFSSVQLADLLTYCAIKPAVNQIECHPLLQQRNLREMCALNRIHVVSYAPLGRPGNLREGDPVLMQHPTVQRIADARGVTPAQVLLQWQVKHGLAAVPKSANVARMTENLQSMVGKGRTMDEEDVAALDAIAERHRFCNKRWCAGVMVFDD